MAPITKFRLNHALPFVKAMDAIVDSLGKDTTYQSRIRDAAVLWDKIERHHGVYFVGRIRTPWNCAVPLNPPSQSKTNELLRTLPKMSPEDFEKSYRPGEIRNDANGFLIHEDDLVQRHLHAFLSETELVYAGQLQCSVMFPHGEVSSWSLREWGNMSATWANRARWHSEDRGESWNYVDFYIHGYLFIERFDEYVQVLYDVLKEKFQLQHQI